MQVVVICTSVAGFHTERPNLRISLIFDAVNDFSADGLYNLKTKTETVGLLTGSQCSHCERVDQFKND